MLNIFSVILLILLYLYSIEIHHMIIRFDIDVESHQIIGIFFSMRYVLHQQWTNHHP